MNTESHETFVSPSHNSTREFLLMIPGGIIILFVFTIFFKLIFEKKLLNNDLDVLKTIELPEPPKLKTVSCQTVITIKNVAPLDEPSTSKGSQCDQVKVLPQVSLKDIQGDGKTLEVV